MEEDAGYHLDEMETAADYEYVRDCALGHFDRVCRLFDSVPPQTRRNGLYNAIRLDECKIAEWLFNQGVQLANPLGGHLYGANSPQMVRILLAQGMNVRGFPLSYFNSGPKLEIIRLLLEAGCVADYVSFESAKMRSDYRFMGLLLQYGFDPYNAPGQMRPSLEWISHRTTQNYVRRVIIARMLVTQTPRALHDVWRSMFTVFIPYI